VCTTRVGDDDDDDDDDDDHDVVDHDDDHDDHDVDSHDSDDSKLRLLSPLAVTTATTGSILALIRQRKAPK